MLTTFGESGDILSGDMIAGIKTKKGLFDPDHALLGVGCSLPVYKI